jgi:chemotaxis protein methyltransferase CheR
MFVTADDIEAVSGLVIDLCGILLDESKGYLIESRLAPLAQSVGCKSYSELVQRARIHNDKALINGIIDAITTNETLFFRDGSPFEALKHKALPELLDVKAGSPFPKRVRVWSAACSTGQEPYSIAITLHDLIPDIHAWDISILATDISDTAIRQASAGRYTAYEIERGMKAQALAQHFTNEGNYWKVKDEIRSLVSFQRRNLLEPFRDVGHFDVIFCRNVAIYFSPAARGSLFRRLADVLTPEGYLFVGSAESLADLGPQFAPQHHCRSVFYQPRKRALGIAS